MIYVIEDDDALLRSVVDFLRSTGLEVTGFGEAESALAAVQRAPPDALVTDVTLPGMSGVELLERVRALDAGVVAIVMTAHGTVQTAVRAMRAGCYEYLEKPVDLVRLRRLLDRALAERKTTAELRWHREQRAAGDELIGTSPAMAEVRRLIRLTADVGPAGPPVLITGETGVGKTRVARAIHEAAAAKDAPFIEVNCAALPATLIEAELFGHERSAFTDAKAARPGLFEAADGGTLFLDEIGELPPEAQAKLLDVVETGRVRRLGAVRPRTVTVRLIAATNVDLDAAMASGRFRRDLFHRLSAIRIPVPPLRARPEDVPLLADAFLARAAQRYRRAALALSDDAAAKLQRHRWPGNIRELVFAVERAVLDARPDVTVLAADVLHLGEEGAPVGGQERAAGAVRTTPGGVAVDLPDDGVSFDAIERAILEAALRKTDGNVVKAAALLELGRDQMRYRIKRLGLDPHTFETGGRADGDG